MAWMPAPNGIHAVNRANYWCEARADPIIKSLPVRSTHRSGGKRSFAARKTNGRFDVGWTSNSELLIWISIQAFVNAKV